MLLELLCNFFFFFYDNSFFIWYLRYCNLEYHPERYFKHVYKDFSPLSYLIMTRHTHYSFANSPNNLINKIIVLSYQQLVKFYENNNLRLGDRQNFFKKLDLTWGGFFFWNNLYGGEIKKIIYENKILATSGSCLHNQLKFYNSIYLIINIDKNTDV